MAHETFHRQIWMLKTMLSGSYTYEELAQMWLDAPENENHSRFVKRTFSNDIEDIKSNFSVAVSCKRGGGYRYQIFDVDYLRGNVASLIRYLSKRCA